MVLCSLKYVLFFINLTGFIIFMLFSLSSITYLFYLFILFYLFPVIHDFNFCLCYLIYLMLDTYFIYII